MASAVSSIRSENTAKFAKMKNRRGADRTHDEQPQRCADARRTEPLHRRSFGNQTFDQGRGVGQSFTLPPVGAEAF